MTRHYVAQFKERKPGHCTGCGKALPETKLGWGLVWWDGSGFCCKCLYDIRKSIGYFNRETITTKAPKKRVLRPSELVLRRDHEDDESDT